MTTTHLLQLHIQAPFTNPHCLLSPSSCLFPTNPPIQMAAKDPNRHLIDIFALPDISRAEIDFDDTSFFSSRQLSSPQLLTPASILQQYPGQSVIKFEHLNLAVKVENSSHLRLEEAQTMQAIRQAFPHKVLPVPEVFGWGKFGEQTFIYMCLIRGQICIHSYCREGEPQGGTTWPKYLPSSNARGVFW